MRTSGIYNDNISVDSIVNIAGQKAGLEAPMLDALFTVNSIQILNNLFADWVNDGVNLWTRQRFMQNLNYNQPYYQLDERVVDVMEMTAASITRVFGSSSGVAFSLNGNAANAFDGNPATVCVCTPVGDTNAYIGFNYNQAYDPSIKYIGIQSNTNTIYTVSIQYSFDNVVWQDAVLNDTNTFTAYAGQIHWICNECPVASQYWRIVETSGATLAIQELYFAIDNTVRLIGQISNGDYEAFANKSSTGSPSSFTLYRTINPRIAVYPTPDLSTYQYLIYTVQVYIQKVTDLYQLVYLPQRFQSAVVNNLAYHLAIIYHPEKAALLKQDADMSYAMAKQEDSEKVPLEFYFEWAR